VLSLLLVFAQHGAVLHELGHLHNSATAGTSVGPDLHASQSTTCATCQAFAQVANPAGARALDFAACPSAFIPTPARCYSVVGADAPTARSRGPPQV
jgi:hypothetical protein